MNISKSNRDSTIDDIEVGRARELLAFNQVAALIALAAGVYFYLWWIESPWLIAGIAWQTSLIVGLGVARHRLAADTLVPIGLVVLVLNWMTALILTAVAPFSYPMGVLQVIIPILAGGPVLEGPTLRRVLIGATLVTGVVVALGLGLEDSELNDAVDEDIQDGIVMVGVPIVTIAIAMATWDTHERQQRRSEEQRAAARLIRESRARLVRAADEERSRIERNLHDGAQQQLVALTMEMRLLKSTRGLADELDPLVNDLESAMENLRELAHGIYPPLLRSRGLTEALRAAGLRSPCNVEVDAPPDRFDPAIEAAVYFCCLEALQNAAKHAGPGAHVIVRLSRDGNAQAGDGDVLAGLICDDGPGFSRASSGGVGLRNMEDRIVAVGGTFDAGGDGTSGGVVRFSIPV